MGGEKTRGKVRSRILINPRNFGASLATEEEWEGGQKASIPFSLLTSSPTLLASTPLSTHTEITETQLCRRIISLGRNRTRRYEKAQDNFIARPATFVATFPRRLEIRPVDRDR